MPNPSYSASDTSPTEEWAQDAGAAHPKGNKAARVILILFILLLLFAVPALLSIRQYTVVGESMEPTLRPGDHIYYTGFSKARFNDLVIFDAGAVYGRVVKRVVGLPGDTISISSDGRLIRNHVLMEEPYLQLDALGNSGMAEITVAAGELFVLGDNRAESIDSRDVRIGPIKQDAVLGVVSNFVRAIGGSLYSDLQRGSQYAS